MSELSPDVIAAINKVGATPLGRKYDRMARKKYGVSGAALAGKTTLGEFGGRSTKAGRGVVSSAGARGPAQFIPSTRAAYIKQYGVDAWKDDASAIEAMMHHQLNTGVEGYNPGMPTYKDYILNQKLGPQPTLRRSGGASGSTGSTSVKTPTKTTVTADQRTIPGQSFEAERMGARRNLLSGGISLKSLLAYKQQVNQLQDIPEQKVAGDLKIKRSGGKTVKVAGDNTVPLGGGSSSRGSFKITGPNPGRLKPELVSYAGKVARIYGKPLTGSDGTGHSRLTVNGNVSEHTTGNATDIPLTGQELIRAGRAALIAAGMPREQALKQNGGLYNVGNHQVIFNTQEGGDHTTHLHISSHAGR